MFKLIENAPQNAVIKVIGVGGGAAVGLRALQLHVTSPSAFVGLNGAYNLNKTDELSDEVVSAFNLFCSGSNEPERIVAAYTQQMTCEGKDNKVQSLFMATETSTEISTDLFNSSAWRNRKARKSGLIRVQGF